MALKTIRRPHDGCHATVSEMYRRRSGWKRHDTAGDTSRSEDRQGGSGRPRRRCFGGRRGCRKLIVSVSKVETNGIDRIAHLQSFHGLLSILSSSLRAIQNFGHRLLRGVFLPRPGKHCRCCDVETMARHFYSARHWATQTGALSTATSWLMTDCGLQSFTTFEELCCPTSHRCDDMHGYKACTL